MTITMFTITDDTSLTESDLCKPHLGKRSVTCPDLKKICERRPSHKIHLKTTKLTYSSDYFVVTILDIRVVAENRERRVSTVEHKSCNIWPWHF